MRLLMILFFFSLCLSLHSQEDIVRVMSFNIRLPIQADGINYWDHRRELVKTLVLYHEPDLIGVQEAFRRQLDELTIDMPQYGWTGTCRTDGTMNPSPDNEFSAILYRKDRFEIVESNTFWLSPTPEKIGSVGWDAALPRIVTWAKLKERKTNHLFYHFNTHFDHMGSEARMESAKLLVQKINEIAGQFDVVVTGDFNSTETDPPFRAITSNTNQVILKDALSISKAPHHGPMNSFAGDFKVSGLKGNRIDFVFVSKNVNVWKHAILSDSWNGRLPSDHLPVLAEISFD